MTAPAAPCPHLIKHAFWGPGMHSVHSWACQKPTHSPTTRATQALYPKQATHSPATRATHSGTHIQTHDSDTDRAFPSHTRAHAQPFHIVRVDDQGDLEMLEMLDAREETWNAGRKRGLCARIVCTCISFSLWSPAADPALNSALDSALDSAFDPAFHPAYDPAFDSALVSESMIGDLVDLEGLVVVENESERHLLHINSIFINVNSGMECHHIVGDKQKWTR